MRKIGMVIVVAFVFMISGCNKTKTLPYISENDFLRYWEKSDLCDHVLGTGDTYVVNLPNGTIRYCMFEDVFDAQKNFEDTRDAFEETKNNGDFKGNYYSDIREQRTMLEMRGAGRAYTTKDCYVGEILIDGKIYDETSESSSYFYGGIYLCGDIVIEAYTGSSSHEDQKVIQDFLGAFEYPIPEK